MSSKPLAYGGVVIDDSGRILLREPSGHYGGYPWSFPKGHSQQGESDRETALREVWEETGVVAEVVARIEGLFEGDTTWNTYFLMRPTGRADDPLDDETASVCWAGSAQKARELIGQTEHAKHRTSLLDVLDAALSLQSQKPNPGTPDPLVIKVMGRPPVPHGGGGEVEWRTHLANRVQEDMRRRPPFPPTKWFSVQLNFFLHVMLTDLDNLAKPVMDTLFQPGVGDNPDLYPMRDITGVLFPGHDDGQARELLLRKYETLDTSEQGVHITVRAFR